MPNPFKKRKFFVFIASLTVAVFVGYFSWSAVIGVGGDFINKVLSYTDKIGAKIFTASILNNTNQFVDAPFTSDDILDEDEIIIEPEEARDAPIVEKRSIQDLLDDIQEKLDIISQQVQELIDNQQEEIEEDEAQEDEKEDDENVDQVVYPKILIFEIKILPIEQRFIKLYNPNSLPVDLTDWYIQRKTETASSWSSCVSSANFKGKTIMPGGYFLISRIDNSANIVLGSLTLTENNSVALKDPNGEISDVAYTVLPISDQQSSGGGGSVLINYSKILINEVQILPIEQRFIELYNPNSENVDLTNWYIQRKTETANSWGSLVSSTKFAGKIILANDYLLISRLDETADILLDNLTLTENNSLILKNPKGEISDKLGYGLAQEFETISAQNPVSDQSLGRKLDEAGRIYLDTDNNSADFEIDSPTPKAQNIKWVEPTLPTLENIEITILPTKLDYVVGDDVDLSGLVVTGNYSDGSTQIETITPENISGFDSTFAVSEQILTITVGGQMTTYTVDINPAPTLQSIEITAPANKLAYTVGDSLDTTGLVITGTYSDGSTQIETITPENISGFDSTFAVSEQILTITVGEQIITYITSITEPIVQKNILVNEIQIEGDSTKDDWVEIYNPNDFSVGLSQWSIQRSSKTGTIYKKNFNIGDDINANGYFLIVRNDANREFLDTADMVCSMLQLSSDGTIYLVQNQEEILGEGDIDIIDKVGWGEAFEYENNPAPIPGKNQSITRILGIDTDDNSADFIISDIPTPKIGS